MSGLLPAARVAPRVRAIFLELRQRALARCDCLPHLKVWPCFQAGEAHARGGPLGHWGHRANTLCVAPATADASEAELRALVARGLGHALDAHFAPETSADEALVATLDGIADPDRRADAFARRLLLEPAAQGGA